MWKALRFIGRAGAFIGAIGCAVAGVAGQAGAWWPKFDAFNHFAPLWLAGGLFCAALGLSLCRKLERKVLLAIAGVAVVTAGSRVVPEIPARLTPGAPRQGEELKLVQLNAYMKNSSPALTVDWLLEEDADIVIIEEGDGLPHEQKLRLRQRYPYCNGCPEGKTWFNMILSKQPAIATGRFELPAPETTFPILGGWSRFSGPGGEFTVLGVHFAWPWHSYSIKQREALAEFVNRTPRERTIVAGDLNMTPWSFALNELDGAIGLNRLSHGQASWPGQVYFRAESIPVLPVPYLAIDQIYAGEQWRRVSLHRGPNVGSDHYPIVVELTAQPQR